MVYSFIMKFTIGSHCTSKQIKLRVFHARGSVKPSDVQFSALVFGSEAFSTYIVFVM
jgi:hypothetical protein